VANGTASFTNTISGPGSITKTGAGTVTLSGTNTYTGTTEVNSGRLLINGSISTSSLTTVASGATIGGSGTLGALTVNNGGNLTPGTSAGALGVNGMLTLNNSSNLNFELNPVDFTVGGVVNDLVTVTGNLVLDGILNLTATSGDFSAATAGSTWRLFNYSGSLTNNALTLGTMPALGAGREWSINTATLGQINLAIIPEPSTALLSTLGVLALLRRRR
jgi:fibronectin-binding autotransporter adhesin